RFLRFSEQAARAAGLESQQHQLLLALKGMPEGMPATIGALAERLQVRHHTTVELVDRMEVRGLVRRSHAGTDRRQVFVRLAPSADWACWSGPTRLSPTPTSRCVRWSTAWPRRDSRGSPSSSGARRDG